MKPAFKQSLREGPPLIGTLLTTPSPQIAETLAQCGFHWLFLDCEHGELEGSDVQDVLRAIGGRCHTLVRIPDHSPAWFKKALDSGADGIIVPLIKTPDQAREAVRHTKYPPLGERSVGVGRAHRYGMAFKEYLDSANDSITLIIQIEHIQAVQNLEAILDIPGIDGILIGPFDLSGSMGLPGMVHDPRVQEQIAKVRQRCLDRKIPVGCFVMQPEAAITEFRAGCRFVAVGTDLSYLWTAAKRAAGIVLNEIK